MEKHNKKFKPQTPKGTVTLLNQGREIDGRTRFAKGVSDVKAAVRNDLPEAARAMLESDIAVAAMIQKLALQQAMRETSGQITTEDGELHHAMKHWLKWAGVKKSALLALRRFQDVKPDDDDKKGLGDLILEVEAEGNGI